jgi:LPPG:FO 2-phospho-L-lactate transferase
MLVVLTGGTGGAKLVQGLSLTADPKDLTVICNTADDFFLHGLYIAPDIDTITYALAGILDVEKGWGINDDSFAVLESLGKLGGETWFKLGDRDMATHISRTRLMREGLTLSQATRAIGKSLGVKTRIVPMSDEHVETSVTTARANLSFQEYFVKHRWQEDVHAVTFTGIENARPAPGILEAIQNAAAIIVCPSNPVTSIGPILAVPEMREALRQTPAPVVAVSPIIQGTAVSGPAHRLMSAVSLEPSACGVASAYADFVDTIFIAHEDELLGPRIAALGLRPVAGHIRMDSLEEKKLLAKTVLEACRERTTP